MVGRGVGLGFTLGGGVGGKVGGDVGEGPPEGVGTLDEGGVGLILAGFAVVTSIVGLVVVFG